MTNHTVTHPRCSPALTFFLLSSTSDYLTCSMYFTVDSLSATLKMSSPSRKVLGPYPTPCPSPAQRTGQDTAGRCSVPSRLQHRGQARTQQGGAQHPIPSPAQRTGQDSAGRCSAPSCLQHRGQARTQQGGAQPSPVSSTELRPALGRGREVLSPLLSPAQRSGRYSVPSSLRHRGQARTQQGGTQPPSVCSTELRPALGRWGADAQSTPKRQTHRLLSRAPLEGCPGARHEEMLAHDLLMDPQRQEGTTL